MNPALLAAIDIGTVFTAVFLIVMFLGWVMQAIQNQNDGGANRPAPGRNPGPRPQQRPRNERIASEIDAFLKEVGQSPPAREEPKIEVVRKKAPEQRRRERPRPAESRRPVRSTPAPAPEPPKRRKAAARRVETPNQLGEDVREQVATYIDERIENDDRRANRVDESVREHLGARSEEMPPSTAKPRAPHPLAIALRNPEGVQQAIVLGEVLAKPRVLRNR